MQFIFSFSFLPKFRRIFQALLKIYCWFHFIYWFACSSAYMILNCCIKKPCLHFHHRWFASYFHVNNPLSRQVTLWCSCTRVHTRFALTNWSNFRLVKLQTVGMPFIYFQSFLCCLFKLWKWISLHIHIFIFF